MNEKSNESIGGYPQATIRHNQHSPRHNIHPPPRMDRSPRPRIRSPYYPMPGIFLIAKISHLKACIAPSTTK